MYAALLFIDVPNVEVCDATEAPSLFYRWLHKKKKLNRFSD